MIRNISNNDLLIINELGEQYINNFSKFYNVNSYIYDDVYKLLCFEENNIIKGFLICTIIGSILEIHLLFVDQKYRNKGVASSLLKAVENYDVEKIILEVSVINFDAFNLYLKNGYKIINTRKKYYNNIDAYVMEKVI